MFTYKLINRLKMPRKHILVCEDDLNCQKDIACLFDSILERQGEIVVSYVSGGMAAAGVIEFSNVDLIVLDHDMPWGSGDELLNWLKYRKKNIPIITFSGIPWNNDHLKQLGAEYIFIKDDVLAGKANDLIMKLLE